FKEVGYLVTRAVIWIEDRIKSLKGNEFLSSSGEANSIIFKYLKLAAKLELVLRYSDETLLGLMQYFVEQQDTLSCAEVINYFYWRYKERGMKIPERIKTHRDTFTVHLARHWLEIVKEDIDPNNEIPDFDMLKMFKDEQYTTNYLEKFFKWLKIMNKSSHNPVKVFKAMEVLYTLPNPSVEVSSSIENNFVDPKETFLELLNMNVDNPLGIKKTLRMAKAANVDILKEAQEHLLSLLKVILYGDKADPQHWDLKGMRNLVNIAVKHNIALLEKKADTEDLGKKIISDLKTLLLTLTLRLNKNAGVPDVYLYLILDLAGYTVKFNKQDLGKELLGLLKKVDITHNNMLNLYKLIIEDYVAKGDDYPLNSILRNDVLKSKRVQPADFIAVVDELGVAMHNSEVSLRELLDNLSVNSEDAASTFTTYLEVLQYIIENNVNVPGVGKMPVADGDEKDAIAITNEINNILLSRLQQEQYSPFTSLFNNYIVPKKHREFFTAVILNKLNEVTSDEGEDSTAAKFLDLLNKIKIPQENETLSSSIEANFVALKGVYTQALYANADKPGKLANTLEVAKRHGVDMSKEAYQYFLILMKEHLDYMQENNALTPKPYFGPIHDLTDIAIKYNIPIFREDFLTKSLIDNLTPCFEKFGWQLEEHEDVAKNVSEGMTSIIKYAIKFQRQDLVDNVWRILKKQQIVISGYMWALIATLAQKYPVKDNVAFFNNVLAKDVIEEASIAISEFISLADELGVAARGSEQELLKLLDKYSTIENEDIHKDYIARYKMLIEYIGKYNIPVPGVRKISETEIEGNELVIDSNKRAADAIKRVLRDAPQKVLPVIDIFQGFCLPEKHRDSFAGFILAGLTPERGVEFSRLIVQLKTFKGDTSFTEENSDIARAVKEHRDDPIALTNALLGNIKLFFDAPQSPERDADIRQHLEFVVENNIDMGEVHYFRQLYREHKSNKEFAQIFYHYINVTAQGSSSINKELGGIIMADIALEVSVGLLPEELPGITPDFFNKAGVNIGEMLFFDSMKQLLLAK
ncbi:MAG: hypothetical protein JSW18_00285, partial [Candidatus Omnitrophota bacterium]